MNPRLVVLSVLSLVLAACGGGSSGGGGGGTTPPETGVFVDAAVAGVSYVTSPGGLEGITNADGEYEFEPGDTVTFSIGELEFPPVTAKGTVTPLDIAGTDDPTDQR